MKWQFTDVVSPHLDAPVTVVAAQGIPYIANANRLQTLNLYLPHTPETAELVGTPADSLPAADSGFPQYYVHVHGGAWRDPRLTATSIEATVAHAFTGSGLKAIASINYTVTQFPTHPTLPYDAIKDNHTDLAREAVHPQHVSGVLHGFALLRSYGLTDGSFVLSGHSCGACINFQTFLRPPAGYGLGYLPEAPCPAAIIGLNGLYDLPGLVSASGLGPSHEHLRDDYDTFLSNAFGAYKGAWPALSPARIDPQAIAARVRDGRAPRLVLLDQSSEDQLVPVSQRERLEANLVQVSGLRLERGHRLTGVHAAPWQEGLMIWDTLQDVFKLLTAS